MVTSFGFLFSSLKILIDGHDLLSRSLVGLIIGNWSSVSVYDDNLSLLLWKDDDDDDDDEINSWQIERLMELINVEILNWFDLRWILK